MTNSEDVGLFTLEVGQGDSHLIVRDRRGVLIDGGPPETADRLLQFLKKKVDHLDAIILTHNDRDHSGGLPRVLWDFGENEKVTAFLGLIDRLPDEGTSSMAALKAAFKLEVEGKLDVIRLEGKPTKALEIGAALGPFHLRGIHPSFAFNTDATGTLKLRRTSTPNRTSGAVHLVHEDGTGIALWMGDLPPTRVLPLVESGVSAKVMVVPHHGSGRDWSAEKVITVLAKVAPNHLIISVGTTNDEDHPAGCWLQHDYNARVLCTQATPQCQAVVDSGCSPTSRRVFDPGRGTPCAGTVVFTLKPNGNLRLRARRSHTNTLAGLGSTLCQ